MLYSGCKIQLSFLSVMVVACNLYKPLCILLQQQKKISNQATAGLSAEIEISQNAVLYRVTRALLHVQATVFYSGEQQKEFKTFLINQLTDLMEGLINPAVIQELERERALQKKYNMLYMRRPRYSWQCTRDLQDLCRLGTGLCVLSIITKRDRSVYCRRPKTWANNVHALDTYELHNHIMALRPNTLWH